MVKKSGILILSPPNRGKSTWAQQEFKGKRAYMRPDMKSKYPFDAGAYNDEEVIIYDDVVPMLDELIDVGETYHIRKHVYPGVARYVNKFWKIGQKRQIIWLLNPERLPDYARPGNDRYEIFKVRFKFLIWSEERGAFVRRDDTPSKGGQFIDGKMEVVK